MNFVRKLNESKIEDLPQSEAIEFIDFLLGKQSSLEVTEKLAGQHMAIRIKPNGEVLMSPKTTNRFFKAMPVILRLFDDHPAVEQEITYEFEIVETKDKRPDYIHYLIDKTVFAEHTGQLTSEIAERLSTQTVVFMTREDLLKKDHGRKIKSQQVEWKPLKSILSSNKKNITLNFKN